MSKSLGNFFTIRDVLGRYHALALRWFLVATHYRGAVNYSPRGLEEVRSAPQVCSHPSKSLQAVKMHLFITSACVCAAKVPGVINAGLLYARADSLNIFQACQCGLVGPFTMCAKGAASPCRRQMG